MSATDSLCEFLRWGVILDAAADLEASAWWLWTRAGSFGWPSTCRDLGLDFVMHRSGQDRWPRGEFGDWRAL